MGWKWIDEPDALSSSAGDLSDYQSRNPSSGGDRCSTRKVVRSQCETEEVEPGMFIRKCDKTEEILRDCVGRPVEVVASNREYTEEDVTDEVLKGSSSVGAGVVFDFPGLRSDIDTIERSFFDGLSRFFGAAEEMKDGFFNAFGGPHVFDGESSSAFRRRTGVPFDNHPQQQHEPKNPDPDSGENIGVSGLPRDV